MATHPQSGAHQSVSFLASRAMLVLLMLMLMLMVLTVLMVSGPKRPAAPSCNPVIVSFDEQASLGQVSSLLGQLGAGIARGPNEQGAFELRVSDGMPAPADKVAAVVEALNARRGVVVVASVHEACRPVQ